MAKTWEQSLEIARSNETRDLYDLEHKCKAAARWLGHNETDWESLIDLIVHIEAGRVYAIDKRPRTQEEIDSWRNYMMNR